MKKAKKATVGEKHVAWWTSQTLRELRNDPTGKKEAEQIDRLIAAAVQKERRRCKMAALQAVDYVRRLGHHNLKAIHTNKERAVGNSVCEDIAARISKVFKPAKNGAKA